MLYFKTLYSYLSEKYHPVIVPVGKAADTQELAEMIAHESSLTVGDVHNVIRSLPYMMANVMKEGRVVKLDGIGTFRYTVSSSGKGVETEAEVNAGQITEVRVRFIPESKRHKGASTTRALVTTDLSFSRWKGDLKRAETPQQPGGGGNEKPGGGGGQPGEGGESYG
jgi:predicted histone-like DNA-binding protein